MAHHRGKLDALNETENKSSFSYTLINLEMHNNFLKVVFPGRALLKINFFQIGSFHESYFIYFTDRYVFVHTPSFPTFLCQLIYCTGDEILYFIGNCHH